VLFVPINLSPLNRLKFNQKGFVFEAKQFCVFLYSSKETKYIDLRGQETGHQCNPATVAQDVRFAREFDGNRRFIVDEFLSPKQVQSYFSQKAAKQKRGAMEEEVKEVQEEEDYDSHEEDSAAAEDEAEYSLARSAIVDECQLKHPIVYESVNLCKLYATQKLNKLSIPFLRLICEDLELDCSGITSRRKAPYIEIINNVLKLCSCVS
jgi:hypothetical protein